MKQVIALLIASAILFSCTNDKKEKTADVPPVKEEVKIDSFLVTDTSWGAINAKTDFNGLLTILGPTNVKDERVCGPECADSINVTVLFEGTPQKATVYWADDSNYHKKIGYIECWEAGSPYHTAAGIKQGSRFSELLKLNGKKITFSGFDWDYGGMIQSYNGGALEKSPIHYQLGLPEGASGDGLLGDTELNTDMPLVKSSLDKIIVTQLSLNLNIGDQ